MLRVETPKSETEPEITQTGSNKKMRDKKGEKEREKEKEKALKEVGYGFLYHRQSRGMDWKHHCFAHY
jgi:hypothetical protein